MRISRWAKLRVKETSLREVFLFVVSWRRSLRVPAASLGLVPCLLAIVAACSDLQIASYADRCIGDSPGSDLDACRAIERDPANTACLKCLFSTVQDETYGPIVIGWDKRWYANVGGCMALIDGDATENGCGAKHNALQTCRNAACANCTT